MDLQQNIPLAPKTTMKIGGTARYFVEVSTKHDLEQAWKFSQDESLPLVILGAGSNTVFADGVINAVVIRITAKEISVRGQDVRADAGLPLGSLIAALMNYSLDLSALAGIPGTVGGAIFGNAGQGPGGIWIDNFVKRVTVFRDGTWETLAKEECNFRYRGSAFKDEESMVIWEATLEVPIASPETIRNEIERKLRRRMETQIQANTAGSCFTAAADGTPAWKLIDEAGLRNLSVGGVRLSEKHVNFLVNCGTGTFADVLAVIEKVRSAVPQLGHVEMRLIGNEGVPLTSA